MSTRPSTSAGRPKPSALCDLLDRRLGNHATHELRRIGVARAAMPAIDGVVQFDGARLVLWAWGAIDFEWAAEVGAALDDWSSAQAVVVRINSQGGKMAAAEDISKRLRQHRGRTIAVVDRACHSAATIVAAGCDLTWMRKGASWMQHRARLVVDGDALELSRASFQAREIDAQVTRRIAACRSLAFEVVRELRDAARYVTAEEAVEIGLADRVIHSLPIAQEGHADVIATSPR